MSPTTAARELLAVAGGAARVRLQDGEPPGEQQGIERAGVAVVDVADGSAVHVEHERERPVTRSAASAGPRSRGRRSSVQRSGSRRPIAPSTTSWPAWRGAATSRSAPSASTATMAAGARCDDTSTAKPSPKGVPLGWYSSPTDASVDHSSRTIAARERDLERQGSQPAPSEHQQPVVVEPPRPRGVDVAEVDGRDRAGADVDQAQVAADDDAVAADGLDHGRSVAGGRAGDPSELHGARRERSLVAGGEVDDGNARAVPGVLAGARRT